MAMTVKNNIPAQRTLNTLNRNSNALQTSLQRVSSGMKINSAQDDASGYAISERMRVRIRSLDQANQNTQNDSSLMKTAEGAVGNTVEILRALKEKAINAANDSNTDEDRQTIQKELNQFIDQIDDNALVQFNGKYLVDGSKNNAVYDTKTILLNQSLDKGTTMSSALIDLKNRAGDSLGIQDTDKYQISWVQNGEIHFTSGNIKEFETSGLAGLLAKATAGRATNTDTSGLISGSAPISTSSADDTAFAMSNTYVEVGQVTAGIITKTDSSGVYSAAFVAGAGKDEAAQAVVEALSALGVSSGTFMVMTNGQEIDLPGEYFVDPSDADVTGGTTGVAVTVTVRYAETEGNQGNGTKSSSTFTVNVSSTGGAVSTNPVTLWKSPDSDGPFTDAYDKFGKAVYTPDKTEGIAFASNSPGVKEQVSGLTISILDQDGNVKKAANAALDQFKQYQRAENQTGDMALNFHIGSEANVAIKVGMGDMRAEALGLKGSKGQRIDVFTKEHANASINVIENALTKALDQQTTIGAIEARLEYTSTNLTTSSENVQAAESTIRDADMAKEMTNYTKNNVLMQAAQAMLAQANQSSSAVLSLLQ